MDFILNSKTKKVEIFYENIAEQQAILEFMSKYLTYKEDKTSSNTYINNPGISWETSTIATTDPYTITINAADLSNNCTDTMKISSELETGFTSTIANSDKNDYNCLTVYVPRPTIK